MRRSNFSRVLGDASSAQCWLYSVRQAGAVHSRDSPGGLHLISEESLRACSKLESLWGSPERTRRDTVRGNRVPDADSGTPAKTNHTRPAVPAKREAMQGTNEPGRLGFAMCSEGWIQVQDMLFALPCFGIRNVYSVYLESMLSDL